MSSERLNIAVVGLGRIGWSFHCKRLAEHPDWELTAVADTEESRRREATATFGCRAFADIEELCAETDLDAVVIATPTHLHEAMVETALRHGLHVILEKPMAPGYAEAERIVQAAEEAGKVLTVYQPHRLNAYFQHLKAIVADGRIGRITMVRRGAYSFSRRNDWQSLRRFGGGMLANYGAHYLDQVLQLIGYDIRRVWCNLQIVASLGDADDVVNVMLETAAGIVADCTISQASIGVPNEFRVWGTRGSASFDGKTITVRYFDPESLPEKQLNPHLASENRQYPSDALTIHEESNPVDSQFQRDLFANFAAAIRGREEIFVPPRETLALMALLERCRDSSEGIRDLRERQPNPTKICQT